MVSRNRDKISLALCLISGIIGVISLILTCIGVRIPSWYISTNANNTIIIAEANLFYACFSPNATQEISTSLTCTSYDSYLCSTTSYQNTVLNTTAYLSGCTNPTNGSSAYITDEGPIYQILIDDFYSLRSAAILSIISILFIGFSTIFAFITAFILMNYLVFIPAILACVGVIFGVCCLVIAGTVLEYTGTGFILFVVGILLEVIATTLLSIVAGRLHEMERKVEISEDKTIYARRSASPIIIRRVQKRRV